MGLMKKSTAWTVLLCLVLSLLLAVAPPKAVAVEETTKDPYVYYWKPAAETIPEYYARYARPYMLYSGHNVRHKGMDQSGLFQVRFFNVVNTEALIADEAEAPAGGYATTGAFCSDAETYIVEGTAYRRMNLEDGYFNTDPDTLEGTVDARKIRAVLRHSMPNLEDLPAFEQKVNDYLIATHGADAVLIKELHGSELISATQSAIWHYSNGFDFSAPYPYRNSDLFENWGEVSIIATAMNISYPDYPTSYVDIADDHTGSNINGVYQYLLSLPGEDAKDVVLTSDAVSLAESVISGSGDDCTVTLFINIDGTINGDDDVTLSVKCGEKTQQFSLGAVNTLKKQADGLYPVTFEGVSQEDCAAVELTLSGEQIIDDVCYFEAKPTEATDGRKTSQNLAGYGHGSAPVYSKTVVSALEATTELELNKVDEQSGSALSGVRFDLYKKQEGDDLKIGSYVTDSDGKITVEVTDSDDYYFVETQALTGYTPITGPVSAGTVSNRWDAGSLQLTKKLVNTTPAQVGETFHFEITLDLSTAAVMGNRLSWMTGQYIADQLETSEEVTWDVSGQKLTAALTLNVDETVTVEGIPLGATYTLEEVMTDEDRQWFNTTAQIDGQLAQPGSSASGTVAQRNAIVFTNHVVTSHLSYGELEVSKKLVNTTPAQVGETFNFEITLDFSTVDTDAPWVDGDYLLDQVQCSEDLTWVQKDGKYTANFTVDADETVTFEGIAQGASYQVQEILTQEERRWFTVTGQIGQQEPIDSDTLSGTVAAHNALEFTNTVVTGIALTTGRVSVGKDLVGGTAAMAEQKFTFRITLDLSDAYVYQDPAPWMNDQYLLDQIKADTQLKWTRIDDHIYSTTIALKAWQVIVLDGVAQGASYTVAEELTQQDRAHFHVTTSVRTNGGTAVQGQSAEVSGNVAADNNVTFINKYLAPVPVTDDLSLMTPTVLCLLALMLGAVLVLNRRRIIGE